jgi:dipeptidyl aminopeptidase/acylaminoacyl peptidase
MRRFVLISALLLTSTSPFAQQKSKPQSAPDGKLAAKTNTTLPLDDAMHSMFAYRKFLEAKISPDGTRVAWVESLAGPDGAPSAKSAIYIAELKSPANPRRITAGDGKNPFEEHDLAWSKDSKRLAFLSDALSRGQLQLFVLELSAGAPRQLTHLKGFLSAPAWAPDGNTIALLFTENATRAAGPLVAETPDEGVVSESFFEQRLALVDPAKRTLRQISPADTYVYEYDWSPDSKRLAIISAKGNGDDNWYIAGLSTIDAASGAISRLIENPGIQIANPRWSNDGSNIAFLGGLMSDEPIPGGDIYVVPAQGGPMRNVTPGMRMTANSLSWAPNSKSIVFAGITDGKTALARADLQGKIDPIWEGAETLSDNEFVPSISMAGDGATSAIIRQSFTNPPEVWAGTTGEWKQITRRNASLKPAWGDAKSLDWTTDIGSVQGWLIYPRDFDPNRKYPMVVCVHGGPSWSFLPQWPDRWKFQMALPSAGYFLFLPNPRGSYGKGEAFTRANVKDFGNGDFHDIMSGVDKAIAAAPIDPDRLGITGWSYGGYMTMWSVTQTARFRAAVSGAGLANFLSYYGENKIDQWMIPFFGATVYDDPAVYAKSAPITFIKKVKTPTLLLVGDSDGECPAPQSFEYWHALRTLGVPTELVIFPHEGHLFSSPAHNREVIERTVTWFDKYLKPST